MAKIIITIHLVNIKTTIINPDYSSCQTLKKTDFAIVFCYFSMYAETPFA